MWPLLLRQRSRAEPPGGRATLDAMADAVALVQGAEEAGIPAGFGLAVISGLADDVRVSSTSTGVSVRMSWPSAVLTT